MIAPTRYSVARLGSTQQQTLQELEAQFGCLIVAYQQEAELAQLAPEGYRRHAMRSIKALIQPASNAFQDHPI